ncbi:NUDIX hydrolase [Belnapia sp. T6]|uniref:NUDIX hydrolase n=1 Tax=Belnapia mucosa TaxID=2804532 RepID=A0ABS1V339_9PROT|nr:NUDIX hydrolase [Belnapia mucosa]MBL6455997.1 NUDIX hydrolase [Belnapia mucosa]
MSRRPKPSRRDRQCAALPYRQNGRETEVLLVTSRETRRWVLPKGWTEACGAARQAAREAFEEAGIRGRIDPEPIGAYAYPKRLRDGATVTCQVEVFPLAVEEMLEDWPERAERERRWFSLPQAAAAVEEGELGTLMLRLAATGR